jgi:NAD(P)-dependent dehydrogenase (short-subunit alcohol dehydrogenase family)
MSDFEKLADKGVLITGGADGIGRALAGVFQSGGARVFIADIAEARLAETASALGCASAVADVTDTGAMEALVDQAWGEVGPLDLLCANAGVVRPGSLLDASREDIDWHFDVNVWGVLNVCRPFVRRLRAERRPGHVLMTGSEVSLSNPAYIHEAQVHVYNMSKHAVLSMADVLRSELAPEGIGVHVLCPGPVSTSLAESSAASRAIRLGGEGEGEVVRPEFDEEKAALMESMLRSPDQIAATALAGLRDGLFVIPTHPHIESDARARFMEIERGFPVR